MDTNTVLWLSGIFLICFLLIIFLVYVILLKEPSLIKDCTQDKEELWDESCTHFQEKEYDPSLQSPGGVSPVLIGFSKLSGVKSPPIYLPLWYRFRYVNSKTGGYSDFSSWTKSPVMSGSCCLPCPGGSGKDCPFSDGYDSCGYNKPTIGVPVNQIVYDPFTTDSDEGRIYMNLHRYTGNSYDDNTPPDKNAQDEIVGILLAKRTVNGVKYFYWIDVTNNPCDDDCDIPTFCNSEKQGCTSCK